MSRAEDKSLTCCHFSVAPLLLDILLRLGDVRQLPRWIIPWSSLLGPAVALCAQSQLSKAQIMTVNTAQFTVLADGLFSHDGEPVTSVGRAAVAMRLCWNTD